MTPNAILSALFNLNKQITAAHEATSGTPSGETERRLGMLAAGCANSSSIYVPLVRSCPPARMPAGAGPVQVAFSRSIEILPIDASITRMAVAEKVTGAKPKPIMKNGKVSRKKIRYMPCVVVTHPTVYVARVRLRQSRDRYGLFRRRSRSSVGCAERHVGSRPICLKGVMSCRGLYVFKHVGTDSVLLSVCAKRARLPPAQRQLDFLRILVRLIMRLSNQQARRIGWFAACFLGLCS